MVQNSYPNLSLQVHPHNRDDSLDSFVALLRFVFWPNGGADAI